jgi:hypothetical protein
VLVYVSRVVIGGIDSEGHSEGEAFESSSPSTEDVYELEDGYFDAATVGGDDQPCGMQDDAVVGMPTPPVEQRIRPRRKYRIPAPMPNEADMMGGPWNNGGPQSQIGGALAVYEAKVEVRTDMEGENEAQNVVIQPYRSSFNTRIRYIYQDW